MNAATNTKLQQEQEDAWIGDAVLGLYIRQWILRNEGSLNGERFTRFTSNESLATIGHPTTVEAGIGLVYSRDGLQAAFQHIEESILPHLEHREKIYQKAQAQRAGAKTGKSKRSRWKKAMGIGEFTPHHK